MCKHLTKTMLQSEEKCVWCTTTIIQLITRYNYMNEVNKELVLCVFAVL